MSVTAPTRPTLLSIDQGDKPIRFTALGQEHKGLVSTIRPGNPEALANAIAMVNEYGGPNMWKVEEVDGPLHAPAPDRGRNVHCTCGAEYSLRSNLRAHITVANVSEQ